MEVECSNSRPPGPESLTGEEEVDAGIIIAIVIFNIINIFNNNPYVFFHRSATWLNQHHKSQGRSKGENDIVIVRS